MSDSKDRVPDKIEMFNLASGPDEFALELYFELARINPRTREMSLLNVLGGWYEIAGPIVHQALPPVCSGGYVTNHELCFFYLRGWFNMRAAQLLSGMTARTAWGNVVTGLNARYIGCLLQSQVDDQSLKKLLLFANGGTLRGKAGVK